MTDVSNISVSAEDRERLAKTKFGEWFDELFEKKFEEAVQKMTSAAPRQRSSDGGQQQQQQQQQQGDHQEARRPRRSLLETCLSDTFGF